MTQDKVKDFIDRTIGSLCANAVDLQFILDRLNVNTEKYRETLRGEINSPARRSYLVWYIQVAQQRAIDLEDAKRIALKLGQTRPDQVFKLLKLKEKLTHKPVEKVAQFD